MIGRLRRERPAQRSVQRSARELAQRLGQGPALLLGSAPDDNAFMAALRRYAPGAERRDDRVLLAEPDLELVGPVEVTPEVAARAGLPPGLPVAYHGGSLELVRGLARILGGTPHPPVTYYPTGEPVAWVYIAEPVEADRMIELVEPHLSGAEVEMDIESDGSMIGYILGADDEWCYLHCEPARRWRRPGLPLPLAVRHLSPDPFLCEITPDGGPGAEPLGRVGELALAVAAATGGIAVNIYDFRIEDPRDVWRRRETPEEAGPCG